MRPNWVYETCAICTREQRLSWHICKLLWELVVSPEHRKKTICLECFLRMADDKLIGLNLRDIKFEGLVFRSE